MARWEILLRNEAWGWEQCAAGKPEAGTAAAWQLQENRNFCEVAQDSDARWYLIRATPSTSNRKAERACLTLQEEKPAGVGWRRVPLVPGVGWRRVQMVSVALVQRA